VAEHSGAGVVDFDGLLRNAFLQHVLRATTPAVYPRLFVIHSFFIDRATVV
jgi:hypothetical protein